MHDVVEFLRQFEPFASARPDALAAAAAAVEIEYFPAGALLRRPDDVAGRYAYVVRTGHVELVDGDRMLDLLGPGDLVAALEPDQQLPSEPCARAAEDTLAYRLPAAVVRPLLPHASGRALPGPRPAGAHRPVSGAAAAIGADSYLRAADLVRPVPVLEPATTVREVVRRMAEAQASSVLVRTPTGLGILTDRDLRDRVLATGGRLDAPVSAVMTPSPVTVRPDVDAETALLQMLADGVRHLPVVDASGQVLGMLDDVDLLCAQSSTPLRLRRRIARAGDLDALREVTDRLPQIDVAAYDSGLPPRRVGATRAILVEALVRRVVELRGGGASAPPAPFAFLLSGSVGRREMAPSSDLDSALVWWGRDDPDTRDWMRGLADQVIDDLDLLGLTVDSNGMRASDPRFNREMTGWRGELAEWYANPERDEGIVYLWALADSRPAYGTDPAQQVRQAALAVREHPDCLHLLGRVCLQHRPPTGFAQGLVVEHSGEHRGRLDLKRGGLSPVVDIARYAGTVAGTPATSTVERLAAARDTGALSDEDARHLDEIHEFLTALRLESQVGQLRRGEAPDNFLDPATLTPLRRRQLRAAFRTIAHVQRGIEALLDLGVQ